MVTQVTTYIQPLAYRLLFSCPLADERRKCDHVLRIPVVHKRIVSLRNHNSNSEDDEVGENVTNSEYRDTCSATSTLLRDDNDNGMNELDAILLTAKLHWRSMVERYVLLS